MYYIIQRDIIQLLFGSLVVCHFVQVENCCVNKCPLTISKVRLHASSNKYIGVVSVIVMP